jgi:hypothetical protein
MRWLVTPLVASALGLAACSSAPGDGPAASGSADLFLPPTTTPSVTCDPGRYEACRSLLGLNGRSSIYCYCADLPCTNLTYPTPEPTVANYDYFVDAWTTPMTNGACPDIVTSTGTWSQMNDSAPACWTNRADWQYYEPWPWSGVPGEYMNFGKYWGNVCPPGQDCCTYVWWPNWYSTSTDPLDQSGSFAPADSQALCGGAQFTAHYNFTCVEGPNQPCGSPGGGGKCPLCMGI